MATRPETAKKLLLRWMYGSMALFGLFLFGFIITATAQGHISPPVMLTALACMASVLVLCDRDLAAGRLVALAEPEVPPINTGYLAIRSGAQADATVARVHAHLSEGLRG